MKRAHIGVLILLGALACICQAQDTRTAVLLELFTSEGCSSCPPADQLLAKIDREQPVKGVTLIVLGEHVDYWNGGGWMDRYSSSVFTERQDRYSTLLHADDPYTPQLVVDGGRELVGSNWPKAKAAIETARHSQKFTITLDPVTASSKRTLSATVRPDPQLPAGDVYLALAADAVDTEVKGGENSGRHLSHTAVAYSIAKIGKISRTAGFEKSIPVPAHSKWGGATRIIVFVQDPATGRILGASQVKL